MGLGRFDELLELAYDGALGVADWSAICRAIGEVLPGSAVQMQMHDDQNPRNLGLVHWGLDPTKDQAYLSRYGRSNPWLGATQERAVGVMWHTDELCHRDTFMASEFWNEWLRPQGKFAAGSGIVLMREAQRMGLIVVNYDHMSDAPRRETEALLRQLGPHLRRAFDLWRRTMVDRWQSSQYEACLALQPGALCIVDGEGRLQFANRMAQDILQRHDGLMVSFDGRFEAFDRGCNERLRAALAAPRQSRGATSSIAMAKVGHEAVGGARYVVTPMPVSSHAESSGFGTFSFHDDAPVLLAIHDTDAGLDVAPEQLAEVFDFTRTEAELANALLEGLTISRIAERRNGTRNTIRNQLSSMMRKTGTVRQSQLVGALTRLAVAC